MKKIISLLVLVFCITLATNSFAKGTDTTEKAGSLLFMVGTPAYINVLAVNSAFVGAPEIVGVGLIALGAYMEYRGYWGKDGTYAVKNCVDTHVNGNCAHLKLSELGMGFVNTNNFSTPSAIDGLEGISVNN